MFIKVIRSALTGRLIAAVYCHLEQDLSCFIFVKVGLVQYPSDPTLTQEGYSYSFSVDTSSSVCIHWMMDTFIYATISTRFVFASWIGDETPVVVDLISWLGSWTCNQVFIGQYRQSES